MPSVLEILFALAEQELEELIDGWLVGVIGPAQHPSELEPDHALVVEGLRTDRVPTVDAAAAAHLGTALGPG
jgi:hypothetical protein